jgi:hypothetical protein
MKFPSSIQINIFIETYFSRKSETYVLILIIKYLIASPCSEKLDVIQQNHAQTNRKVSRDKVGVAVEITGNAHKPNE